MFEGNGIEPYFSEREQAIHYAESRTALRRGEIRILNTHGEIEETITFDERSDWGARQQVPLNLSASSLF